MIAKFEAQNAVAVLAVLVRDNEDKRGNAGWFVVLLFHFTSRQWV